MVQFLQCDNAGENIAGLKAVCDSNGITMEFTAPHTPQMNGVVERLMNLQQQSSGGGAAIDYLW